MLELLSQDLYNDLEKYQLLTAGLMCSFFYPAQLFLSLDRVEIYKLMFLRKQKNIGVITFKKLTNNYFNLQ